MLFLCDTKTGGFEDWLEKDRDRLQHSAEGEREKKCIKHATAV